MEKAKPSIDEEAIPAFKLAVRLVAFTYWEHISSTFNGRKKITFCALSHDKACKIVLNGSGERRGYSAPLKKSLEILDDWAIGCANKELTDVLANGWSNNSYSQLRTCVKDVGCGSNTEFSFWTMELLEEAPKLHGELDIIFRQK